VAVDRLLVIRAVVAEDLAALLDLRRPLRQAELGKFEQQPPLGGLRRPQRGEAVAVAVVVRRPLARQRAARAQLAGGRREPVAGRELGIGAALTTLTERDDLARPVVVGERGVAVHTAHALEGHKTAAGRAGEGAHRTIIAAACDSQPRDRSARLALRGLARTG